MYVKPGDSKDKEEMRVIANWGDTLWSLAEDYSVSADEIRRANNMSQVLTCALAISSYELNCEPSCELNYCLWEKP
jgi:hypothetical protein